MITPALIQSGVRRANDESLHGRYRGRCAERARQDGVCAAQQQKHHYGRRAGDEDGNSSAPHDLSL